MYSFTDIKKAGSNLYKNIATKSQFGKDINKAGEALGTYIYNSGDVASKVKSGDFRAAAKSYEKNRKNLQTAAVNTAKGFGDVAYQATGARQFKQAGTEFNKGNYAGAFGQAALGTAYTVPLVSRAAGVAMAAPRIIKVLPNASNYFTKTVRALTQPTVNKAIIATPFVQGVTSGLNEGNQQNYSNGYSGYAGGYDANNQFIKDYATKWGISEADAAKALGGVYKAPAKSNTGSQPKRGTATGTLVKKEKTGDNTVNTSQIQTVPMKTPQQVANEAAYAAALAKEGYDAERNQYNITDAFNTNLQQATSGAADVYGGRAPAILGNALAGVQSNYQVNMGNEALREGQAQIALLSNYDEATRKAALASGQNALDIAMRNATKASQAKKILTGGSY